MSFIKNLFKKKDANEGKIDLDEMMLSGFLHCESIYRHQSINTPRFSKESPATIGYLIKALYPKAEGRITDACILSIDEFGGEPETKTLYDSAEIESLQPYWLTSYVNDKGEELPVKGRNIAVLVRFDKDAPIPEIVFHIRGVDGFYHGSPYIRISFMIPPLGQRDSLHSGIPGGEIPLSGENCCAQQFSFLIVEEHKNVDKLLAQYEEIEREVNRKLQAGEELTSLERTVFKGFEQFNQPAEYAGYGQWLAKNNRWFDAYRQLIRLYNVASHSITANLTKEENSNWFYPFAHDLGKCLFKLGRLDEAVYFFSLAAERIEDANRDLDNAYLLLCDIRASRSLPTELQIREEEIRKVTEKPLTQVQLSIGDMLSTLFGAVEGSLTSMTINYDGADKSIIIREQQKVWDTPLLELAKDGTTALIMYNPVGYITGNKDDQSKLCVNNTFVIRTRKAVTEKNDGLMRINIMLPAFNFDDDTLYPQKQIIPEGLSFIVGTNNPPHANGRFHNDEYGHCFDLVQSGRFLEGLFEAKYILKHLMSRWETLEQEQKDDFFEAAYQVGFCYMDFGLKEKANYYLEIASGCNYHIYMREYLNCLSNSHDPRTLSVIDRYLGMDLGDAPAEFVHDWMSFLKRRKAYTLIDAKQYDAAKQVLLELIKDPDPTNVSFAKGELDYIDGK